MTSKPGHVAGRRRRGGLAGVLSRAADAGIRRIEVPTPFSLGVVNAYVIEDDPLTLVDAGPNSGTSLDALQRGLELLGHAVEDLGLIVVTHQHMDHLGLVDLLATRSGADIAALGALAPWAADWSGSMAAEDAYADAIMRMHGVPSDIRSILRATTAVYRGWGASMRVTVPLVNGTSLALRDRTIVVHNRPGHSPSDIVLHDEPAGVLLAGDHLLPDTPASPLISRPLTGDADTVRRPSALLTYAASLRSSRAMDVGLVLPGHGDPFEDHRDLVDQRLTLWHRHATRLHGLLLGGPRTAYELAQSVRGTVTAKYAYHVVSSVLGEVDLLMSKGLAREALRDDGVVVFTGMDASA